MVGERLLCSMGRRGKTGARCTEREGFVPSRGGGLGAGVYVTRSEQKAAMCSDRPGNDGVITKLKVALGTYTEIYEQAPQCGLRFWLRKSPRSRKRTYGPAFFCAV
jgi:hypothetical protein